MTTGAKAPSAGAKPSCAGVGGRGGTTTDLRRFAARGTAISDGPALFSAFSDTGPQTCRRANAAAEGLPDRPVTRR